MRHQIIELALQKRGAETAQSSTFAAAAVAAVRSLLAELKPLVGELATRALYVRSLHLARSSFERPPPEALTLDSLLGPLEQDLAARDPTGAAIAGRALLHSLADLLVSLIGEHLTHRMLRTAWGIPASELPSEEKPR